LRFKNGYAFGVAARLLAFALNTALLPLVVPYCVTTPLWLLFRRSQRVASLVFVSVFMLYMLMEYGKLLLAASGK